VSAPAKSQTGKGAKRHQTGHALRTGKTSGKERPAKNALGIELAQELRKLRPILKDIGTAVMVRLDGELAGLALALDGEALHEGPHLPDPFALAAMLGEVRKVKVKPRKGRVKDLGRIESLLDALNGRMPPGA
jgi:hypothetical protein